MVTNRIDNAKRNIFWGILSRILLLVCPFILRTIMIYIMGIEYAGLGNLFTSILQILSLSELGIGSALVFCMYKLISENDIKTVNALLLFYKRCYTIIGSFLIVIGLTTTPFVSYLISGEYPSNINIYILYLIYILNSSFSYFFAGYKRVIFAACQRLDIESKYTMFITVLQYSVQILVLLLYKSYYIYIIILPISTILTNILLNKAVKREFPQFHPEGKISSEYLILIKEKVIGIIFQKIGTAVLTSVDSIIISMYLGLSILGIYNNYIFVISALFSILNAILLAIIPSIGNCIATENINKNKKNFYKFNFIYCLIISWCSTCLFVLYQPFMNLWLGKSLGDNALLPCGILIGLTLYFYVLKMGDIVHAYKEGKGLWSQAKLIPIIAAMINLILNVCSVKYIGLYGVVFSTVISVLLVYFPADSYILFKYYFNDKKGWKKFLLTQLNSIIIAIFVTVIVSFICNFEFNDALINMLIKTVVCSISTTLIYIAIYHKTKLFKEMKKFVWYDLLKKR